MEGDAEYAIDLRIVADIYLRSDLGSDGYRPMAADGFRILELPFKQECLKYTDRPQRGKNIFIFGMLGSIYTRDMQTARKQVQFIFRKKSEKVIEANLQLLSLVPAETIKELSPDYIRFSRFCRWKAGALEKAGYSLSVANLNR